MGRASLVKSATRALDVLELLAATPDAMSHGDIARALRIPKSSLTDLLGTLEQRHYVTREGSGTAERMRLGPAVLALAGVLLRRTDVTRIAQPVVAALMTRTNESAALVVRQGTEVVVVCKENCNHPILYSLQLGERGPVNASAGGKAILGMLPAEEVDAILASGPLPRLTPRTITDPAVLRRELAAVARDGVAFSREEMIEGIVALGHAVLDATGRPCAGLSVGVPKVRFTRDKERLLTEALRAAAADISSMLGWRGELRRAAE
ncbi:IclR family transcriptional regulator [Roseomonas sp. AR75]|uniref:IclR family transcriptional regulator n=1 Tax=Roseomonas sp. AR75 TaxID=2562311 RepID=UPI0021109684|nr:IclR family transcriptional regulator [Roseomonas sp. AR75]